jgi:hypothetical protein
VNHTRTRPSFARGALRVALCYILALQAFAAAFGTALSIGQYSGSAAGFIICHNAGSDAPADRDGGKLPATVPCALCAVASSVVSLSDPVSIVAVTRAVAEPVRYADVSLIAGPRTVRAGLARAPPHLI